MIIGRSIFPHVSNPQAVLHPLKLDSLRLISLPSKTLYDDSNGYVFSLSGLSVMYDAPDGTSTDVASECTVDIAEGTAFQPPYYGDTETRTVHISCFYGSSALHTSYTITIDGSINNPKPVDVDVTLTVTGGWNGGATINVIYEGNTVFTTRSSDTWNRYYDIKDATITIGSFQARITIPDIDKTSPLVITFYDDHGNVLATRSIRPNGSNNSYGYSYSDTVTLSFSQ